MLGHNKKWFAVIKYDDFNKLHLCVCDRCGNKMYEFNRRRSS